MASLSSQNPELFFKKIPSNFHLGYGLLKRREYYRDKIEDREVDTRSLKSGKSDGPVDLDKFGKKTRMYKDGSFKIQ